MTQRLATTPDSLPEMNSPPAPTGFRRGSARRFSTVSFYLSAGFCLVTAAIVLLAPLPNTTIGALCVLLMIALMTVSVPVAIAMFIGGFLGIVAIAGPFALVQTVTDAPFGAAASWPLSVLPMFILMGLVMWRSGLTAQIFRAAQSWLGFLPGSLAVATNFSGAALASASGSSAAISYALGRIAIPEMLRAKYKPSLATAVVAMAGTLGNLIPPSIVLVIYAGVAGTPVGPQLLAAVVPGVLIAICYGVLIVVRAWIDPTLAPKADTGPESWRFKFGLLKGVWPVPVIILVVLGTMYTGFGTATEAGALGALAAVIAAFFIMRKKGGFLASMKSAVLDGVSSFAAIMFLFVGVAILNRMVSLSGLAQSVSTWVADQGLDRMSLLLLLIALYLVLGMFMDTLAMILLTVPVFAPTLMALDIDMIWFGVFIAIMAELAVVTPPLGVLAFIVHRIAQSPDVNLGQTVSLPAVFKGCLWFVMVSIVFVVILILFPELALWLPGQSRA